MAIFPAAPIAGSERPTSGSNPFAPGNLGGSRVKLDERQRIMRQVDVVRSILEKTDRIVTGRPLTIHITDPPSSIEGSPAWTDGDRIFFNRKEIEKDVANRNQNNAEFVVTWKGANYHEVGHVLFSPRMQDPLMRWLLEKIKITQDSTWFWAYNALEDQRIEMLYTSLYPSTLPYFRAVALRWLVTDTSALGRVFPLIHGRKFLPHNVRVAVRRAFKVITATEPDLAVKFGKVIDAYLRLVLPMDDLKARKLIEAYYNLIRSSNFGQTPLPDLPCADNGKGKKVPAPDSDNVIKSSNPAVKGQKRASEKVKDQLDSEAGDDLDDMWGDESSDGGEDGEGEGKGKFSDGKGKDENSDKPDFDPNKKVEQSSTWTPGTSADDPLGESPDGEPANESPDAPVVPDLTSAIQDAMRKVQDALDAAMDSIDLVEDVRDTMRAIHTAGAADGTVVSQDYGNHKVTHVEPEELAAQRAITQQLQTIQLDLEPVWLRSQPVGRINATRVLQHAADSSMIDIFDQWDEGNEEEAGVEVVILIDLSYSMGGQIAGASRALWALKRSFDIVEIRTTVIGFSDAHVVMYKPDAKSAAAQVPIFEVIGGTVPDSALREAYNILSRSDQLNKVLVAITDGAWQGDVGEQDTIIAALRRDNVVTALVALGHTAMTWGGTHNMEIAVTCEHVREITQFVNRIVSSLLKQVVMH